MFATILFVAADGVVKSRTHFGRHEHCMQCHCRYEDLLGLVGEYAGLVGE